MGGNEMELGYFVLICLVLWFIVSLAVGSYISAAKGRHFMEGTLFTFLFGPFGMVVAACLPTVERSSVWQGAKPMVPPPPQAPMQQRSIRHQPAETSIPEEPIRQIPGDWGSKMDDDEAMKYLDG